MQKFSGRKLGAIGARGSGLHDLSFERNGFVIDVQNVRDGGVDRKSGQTIADWKLAIIADANPESQNDISYLAIFSNSRYSGDPVSDSVTSYTDGNMHVTQDESESVDLDTVDDPNEIKASIELTKGALLRVLGLEPVDQSETEEDMKHRLEHLT